jgi:formylglycine-generating enzyme required for sulfatase activity
VKDVLRPHRLLLCRVILAASVFLGAPCVFAANSVPPTSSVYGVSRATGAQFRECADCPQMIVIPAGRFTMSGKTASDGRADDDPEGIPKSAAAREVGIDAAFAAGIYDVTVGEFGDFVRASGWSGEAGCRVWNGRAWLDDKERDWRSPGFRQTARDPVVCVSWNDAQAYVQWLNRKVRTPREGSDPVGSGFYRLLTWEESEYATGGGATTAYYWSSEPRHDRANYGADDCFPCRPARYAQDRWLYTSPAGSFPPNAFGLYDMAGNVWQWTENCVRGSPTGLRWDPLEPAESCRSSAIHGGSWLTGPQYLRTGEYALSERTNHNTQTGFRVARTLTGDNTTALPDRADALSTPSGRLAEQSERRFRDCPHCPEMIVIPPGSFSMGSPPPRQGWDSREAPQHSVRIDSAFAMSLYDVTRAQYSRFIRETHRSGGKGCDILDAQGRWITDPNKDWHSPGFPQTDFDPVVCVSWEDATAYALWLNQQARPRIPSDSNSRPYRLPSEAEWEYAARSGTVTPYYWGNNASHESANYGLEECYPCGAAAEGRDRWYYTSPVASFPPNAFGLYDMLGDVWQWTQDCMHYGYEGAPTDGSVWAGGECKLHVLRGGSWLDPARFLTVTLRNPWGKSTRNQANGFRVVRSLD